MRAVAIVGVLLVVGAGAASGFLLAERHGSVATQAMDAYKAGDYATALPLLKKWAATPEVRNDKDRFKTVMAYIVDAQQKLQGGPTSAPAVAAAQPDVAALQAQAAAVAATQSADQTSADASDESIDPTTGKKRVPHTPIPTGQVAAMTIKELGNFNFDPTNDTDIPPDVKLLNGAKVRLRGFMIPLTQAENITDFALVPSLVSCCFGQPPGVQHTITCKTEKGKAVQYTVDEVNVEGTLSVNIKRDQGYTYEIFGLQVSSVTPVE